MAGKKPDIDPSLDALYLEYQLALDAGVNLNLQEVIDKNPELEKEIRAFLADEKANKQEVNQIKDLFQDSEKVAYKELEGADRNFRKHVVHERIDQGGMGVVYRAWHIHLQRDVALKVIRAGMFASAEDRQRFLVEAQSAAGLVHPNIIQIYEIGTVGGEPWFSMEFAKGGCLADQLGKYHNAPQKIARLLAVLARAVDFAHRRGVLHRDLKPANILLMEDESPKVADFGLAKRFQLEAEVVEEVVSIRTVSGEDTGSYEVQDHTREAEPLKHLTRPGSILGTAKYMAPEQATPNGNVTTAADTYGLGTILYELLTGKPPFDGETREEILQKVREEPPALPRKINKRIPQDLQAICLKCLEKSPEQRYPTAAGLAEDLDCYLRTEPVRARKVTPVERILLQVRRQPGVTGLLALVFMLFIGLIGVILWEMDRLSDQIKEDEYEIYTHRIALAERQINTGQFELALENLNECPVKLRGWDWHFLIKRIPKQQLRLVGHERPIVSLCYSFDGKYLLTGSTDGTARVWDLSTNKTKHILRGHHRGEICVCFTEGGKKIATAGMDDQGVCLWDAETGNCLKQYRDFGDQVCCDKEGTRLAAIGRNRVLTVLNLQSEEKIWELHVGEKPICLKMSSDGKLIALSMYGKKFRLLDISSTDFKEVQIPDFGDTIFTFAFSSDDHYLVCGLDKPVFWDLKAKKLGKKLPGQRALHCADLDFSPQGNRLLATYRDGIVRVWDTNRGTPDRSPLRQFDKDSNIYARFSPDGESLAVTSGRHVIIETLYPSNPLSIDGIPSNREFKPPASQSLANLSYNLDGRWLASRGETGDIIVWDVKTGKIIFQQNVPTKEMTGGLAFYKHRNQTTLIAGSETGPLGWIIPTGQRMNLEVKKGEVNNLVISPERFSVLAWTSNNHSIQAQDISTSGGDRAVSMLTSQESQVDALAIHSSNGRLAAACRDSKIRIWNLNSPKVIESSLPGPKGTIMSLEFSRTNLLAAGGAGEKIHLWNLTNKQVHELPVYRCVTCLSFSPDGARLASGASDGIIKIWETHTGRELLSFRGHTNEVTSVVFSHDGNFLASCGRDGVVRLWDGTPEE